MSAHTPGPWIATVAGVTTPEGIVVCEAPIHYLVSALNWTNNATLIAAAPDLLAALLLICDSGVHLHDDIERPMLAAIDKARGVK
jgi:hypothetical protein